MVCVKTVKDLINLWPTRAEMAVDVSKSLGDKTVTVGQVHKWAQFQSIPARFHWAVIAAGTARGFDLTAEIMVRLHANVEASREDAA